MKIKSAGRREYRATLEATEWWLTPLNPGLKATLGNRGLILSEKRNMV